jgi:gas vesicle protein
MKHYDFYMGMLVGGIVGVILFAIVLLILTK